MQYSDTANKTGIIQYAEVLTGLGDAGISGNTILLKQFTTLINNWYNYIQTIIMQAQDDWNFDDQNITTSYPIAVRNMVANQPDYLFSTALWGLLAPEGASNISNAAITPLKILRVEATYDGTNWFKAEPFTVFERGKASDTTSINADFNTSQPFYEITFSALKLYPVPTTSIGVGAQIKVFFVRNMNNFSNTDTTKVPGFDVIFHPILAIGATYEFSLSNDLSRADRIKIMLDEGLERLRQHFGTKNRERNVVNMKAADPGYE